MSISSKWNFKIWERTNHMLPQWLCCRLSVSALCLSMTCFQNKKNLLFFSRKQKELKKDSMAQREREKNRKENLTTLSFLQKSILIFFLNDFLYPSSQLKLASLKRFKHFEIIIFLLIKIIKINYLWNDMASLALKLDLEIKKYYRNNRVEDALIFLLVF